jgi:Ca2+-binding EF-hand superfamily protein
LLRDVLALKNADQILSDVLKTVDTDGDGHIQYNGQHHGSHDNSLFTNSSAT